MTALPATRADAMKFVDGACGVCGPVDLNTWLGLIALALRGAETVGATEAWLFAPPIERGNDARQIMAGCVHPTKEMGEEDWEGETDRPIVRRCLILPDES